MKIQNKIYKLFKDSQFEYKIYECENEADFKEFKRLFIEEKILEQSRLIKGPAGKYFQTKCNLFGFYKSYPELFNVLTANNNDNPGNFYQIDLIEKPFFQLFEAKIEKRNDTLYTIKTFLGNPFN